jgi:hypothetical protein
MMDKTNGDVIRAMSNEELATLIMCPCESGFWDDYRCSDREINENCADCCKKWLSEVAES